MSSVSIALPETPANGVSRSLRIFVTETRFEILRALRTRAFSISSIGFPVMFYVLFGLVMNRHEAMYPGISVAKYLLGGYAVFGALGAAIFGVGVGVALDRTAGWLELKQASPMPPLAYVLAKACMAIVFSLIIVGILTLLGIFVGHVHITLREVGAMAGIAAVGAVPFCCLGLAMAFFVPPSSAGGIANLIYLPMSFLSGLWVPLPMLPHGLQEIAPLFPSYHLAQLMYHALGAPQQGTTLGHYTSLLGFTLLMAGVAWLGYQRTSEQTY